MTKRRSFWWILLSGWASTATRSFLHPCWRTTGILPGAVEIGIQPRQGSFSRTATRKDWATNETDVTKIKESRVDEDGVSDAEALLACFTFLKRRKRLGGNESNWTQYELRQRLRASAQPHYFWEEDLSEIIKRRRRKQKQDSRDGAYTDEGEESFQEDDFDDIFLDDINNNDNEFTTFWSGDSSGDADDVWSGHFTSFPTEPSMSFTRRSQSSKKKWMDPDFRGRWYQERWGSHMAQKNQEEQPTEEERRLEEQIRALPPGFLGSAELSNMTQDEISAAIHYFLTTKQKRIASRQKTLEARKTMLQNQMNEIMERASRDNDAANFPNAIPTAASSLSRNPLFTQDETALKEAQRKRSERAKRIYQTRLENEEKRRRQAAESNAFNEEDGEEDLTKRKCLAAAAASKSTFQPRRTTPQDAMIRIQRALDQGLPPSSKDVEIIMQMSRLPKRRPVLRQILAEHFHLRGRCVPTKSGDLEFVTKSAMDDLGALVVDLLRRLEQTEATKNERAQQEEGVGSRHNSGI